VEEEHTLPDVLREHACVYEPELGTLHVPPEHV
jgi:hypothetical protein